MSYEFVIRPLNRQSLSEMVAQIRSELPAVSNNGDTSLLLEEPPDVFVTASENPGDSVSVYFAYGGSTSEFQLAFELAFLLASQLNGLVFDPQLDTIIDRAMYDTALGKWHLGNQSALKGYADGFHYLRQVIAQGSEKLMIEARRFDNRTAENWASVGVGYSRSGDYRRALKCFKNARKMARDDPRILYSLGLTHFLSGNQSKAVRHLRQAVSLDPDHEPSKSLLQELAGAGKT